MFDNITSEAFALIKSCINENVYHLLPKRKEKIMKEGLIEQLRIVRQFFLNTIKCLAEEDSTYAPTEEM